MNAADLNTYTLISEDGHYELELVPEFGGLINAFCYTAEGKQKQSLLAGCEDRTKLANNRYYRGVVLYPYANRVDAGRYTHAGISYQFEVNEAHTNTSLHGFLLHLTPEVVPEATRAGTSSVTLRYHYRGEHPAYPFPAEINMQYLLSHDGLTVNFAVKNLHSASVPLSMGWHPYFALGNDIEQVELCLPPVQKVEVNERLLPTGTKTPFKVFARARQIGAWEVDNAFLLEQPQATVATTLWADSAELGIEFWQNSEQFPYIHVFIPPDRGSITLEPVTSAINAFNSKEDLITLEAGAVFRAQCGVRVLHSRPASH